MSLDAHHPIIAIQSIELTSITPALKVPFHPELLLDIARKYGTPTYVYNQSVIQNRIRTLRSHLEGLPLDLYYAMKANHAVPVMQTILAEGLGIDAVSPAELLFALEIGFAPENILFSANNMTDEEMHFARSKGVTLNVGSLSRLKKLGQAYPGSEVCVRINPQVGAGHHEHVITAGSKSKFGIPVEQMDEVHALVKAYNLKIKGLHQHIGSGILDTDTLWKAISVMLEVSMGFDNLSFINVGGGLGVPYRPDERGIDMDQFESKIVQPLSACLRSHPSSNLKIWFEPGRFFTAESGILLATVNTLKQTPHRTFAGMDSGMNHLIRPAMYDAYHEVVNLSNPSGERIPYDLVGNICESSDFFAKNRPIQELSEGDVVAVLDTGAYGLSMATTYNMRSLPAEVWIDEALQVSVIRKRKSAEDIVREVLDSD